MVGVVAVAVTLPASVTVVIRGCCCWLKTVIGSWIAVAAAGPAAAATEVTHLGRATTEDLDTAIGIVFSTGAPETAGRIGF